AVGEDGVAAVADAQVDGAAGDQVQVDEIGLGELAQPAHLGCADAEPPDARTQAVAAAGQALDALPFDEGGQHAVHGGRGQAGALADAGDGHLVAAGEAVEDLESASEDAALRLVVARVRHRTRAGAELFVVHAALLYSTW